MRSPLAISIGKPMSVLVATTVRLGIEWSYNGGSYGKALLDTYWGGGHHRIWASGRRGLTIGMAGIRAIFPSRFLDIMGFSINGQVLN